MTTMKFITQKFIFLLILFVIINLKNSHGNSNARSNTEDDDDDLLDFDFDTIDAENKQQHSTEIQNHTKIIDDATLADTDLSEENEITGAHITSLTSLQNKLRQREEFIKNTIVNTMRNEKIKRNIAQILPILRVMTPTQKLALATLVQKQVLDVRENPGYDLNEINALFGQKNQNASSELLLPISLDVANLFRKARHIDSSNQMVTTDDQTADIPKSQELKGTEENNNKILDSIEDIEKIPEAQELRGLPPPPYLRRNIIHQKLSSGGSGSGPFRRNIIEQHIAGTNGGKLSGAQHRLIGRKPSGNKILHEIKDNHCDTVVNGICFETNDYPLEPIMLAIRRNKDAMHHLFAEYHDINQTTPMFDNDLNDNNRRTGDDSSKGLMCETMIKYARPKKAKATSGKWKFVVNTPEHTQTLRIEKCLKPYDTCSYLTDNYKTHCMQVYNYHRLLTWDKRIGLHMDIFKVPTCCSCHVKGYKATYPPETYSPYAHGSHLHETYPGHDIGDDTNVDPNLIVNESHFDQTLAFGDIDEHRNIHHHTRNPVTTSYGSIPVRKPIRSSNAPPGSGLRYRKNGIPPAVPSSSSDSDIYDDNYTSNSKIGLSHYLEVPPSKSYATNPFLTRPHSGPSTGGQIKRGAVTLPPSDHTLYTTSTKTNQVNGQLSSSRRPTQLVRQRPARPQIPVYDLEYESSDIQQSSIQTSYPYMPSSTTEQPLNNDDRGDNTTPEPAGKKYNRNIVTKRINYNYHPIIDFFDPINHRETSADEAQKRIDVNNDDLMGGWRPVTAPAGLSAASPRRQTI